MANNLWSDKKSIDFINKINMGRFKHFDINFLLVMFLLYCGPRQMPLARKQQFCIITNLKQHLLVVFVVMECDGPAQLNQNAWLIIYDQTKNLLTL